MPKTTFHAAKPIRFVVSTARAVGMLSATSANASAENPVKTMTAISVLLWLGRQSPKTNSSRNRFLNIASSEGVAPSGFTCAGSGTSMSCLSSLTRIAAGISSLMLQETRDDA